MTNIGFYPLGSTLWYGGVTYLENLFTAIKTLERNDISKVLFLDESLKPEYVSKVCELAEPVIKYQGLPHLKKWSFPWLFQALITKGLGRDPFSTKEKNRLIKDNAINVTFEVYGSHFSIPSKVPRIGWITDFQHIHLPHLSTEELVKKRDKAIRITVKNATRIVVSSEDALNDLRTFDPDALKKAHVLHFVSQLPAGVYDTDPRLICDQYNLPEKFVYLPNQFWKHKNHHVAFESIRILKSRGINVFLVCTGNTVDDRTPLYFARTLELISKWGIRDQIAILGLIPYENVYRLMRQSVCVLNPSLFEGRSTTVEEAKSLGKSVVLSDLNVHIEQNPPGGVYFKRHNPEDLADKLEQIYLEKKEGPDKELEKQARSNMASRTKAFGEAFLRIAQMAISSNKRE